MCMVTYVVLEEEEGDVCMVIYVGPTLTLI